MTAALVLLSLCPAAPAPAEATFRGKVTGVFWFPDPASRPQGFIGEVHLDHGYPGNRVFHVRETDVFTVNGERMTLQELQLWWDHYVKWNCMWPRVSGRDRGRVLWFVFKE